MPDPVKIACSVRSVRAVATATLMYKVISPLNFLLTVNYRQLGETAEVLMDVTVKIYPLPECDSV